MKPLILIPLYLILFLLSGCNSENRDSNTTITKQTKAFFGDKEHNCVRIIDVEKMQLSQPIDEVFTEHEITYTADKVFNQPKVYVVNRGSNAIDVISTETFELTKTIELKHFPRSAESMNIELNLSEATGMDKPMATIIDIVTDEIIATVGENKKVDTLNNPTFGGSHATGHPFWLDKNHFIISDRYNREISTYYISKESDKWITKKLNTLKTTTSIHQIIPSKGNYKGEENIFYGTAEGAKGIYPSIIQFKFEPKKGLKQIKELTLQKEGIDVDDMWLHHGDFHPTQKLLYVGSGDGTLFIVNYESMKIVKTIKVGKGAGHTVMIKKRDLAVVINHKDTFVTVIDTKTNRKIIDIKVSDLDHLVGNAMIQAHPKYHVSSTGQYMYAFLTEDGAIYELDLEQLKVSRSLKIGGQPSQGSFVKY